MDLIAHWLKDEQGLQTELHQAMLAMGQQLHETPEAEQWPLRQWRSWLEENSFDLALLQQALQQLFANAGEAEPYAAIHQELSQQPGDGPGIERLLNCAEHHSEALFPQLLEQLEAEAKEIEALLQTSGGSSSSHHKGLQYMSNHRAMCSTIGAGIGAVAIYKMGKAGYKRYQEKVASDLFNKHHAVSIPQAAQDRFDDEENPFNENDPNISKKTKDMYNKYKEIKDLSNYAPDAYSHMDNTAIPGLRGYSSISEIKKVDATTSEMRSKIQDLIRWFPGRKNIHDQHEFWESLTSDTNTRKGRQPLSLEKNPALTKDYIDNYNERLFAERAKANWYQDNINKAHAHCKKLGKLIDNSEPGTPDSIENLTSEDTRKLGEAMRELATTINNGELIFEDDLASAELNTIQDQTTERHPSLFSENSSDSDTGITKQYQKLHFTRKNDPIKLIRQDSDDLNHLEDSSSEISINLNRNSSHQSVASVPDRENLSAPQDDLPKEKIPLKDDNKAPAPSNIDLEAKTKNIKEKREKEWAGRKQNMKGLDETKIKEMREQFDKETEAEINQARPRLTDSDLKHRFGLQAVRMNDDGNCFYHSIAEGLKNIEHSLVNLPNTSDLSFNGLRKLNVEHIKKNPSDYLDLYGGQDGLNKRISEHKRNGDWVDQPEIKSLAEALKINIAVINERLDSPTITQFHDKTAPTIFVEFKNGNHYDLLSPIEDEASGQLFKQFKDNLLNQAEREANDAERGVIRMDNEMV